MFTRRRALQFVADQMSAGGGIYALPIFGAAIAVSLLLGALLPGTQMPSDLWLVVIAAGLVAFGVAGSCRLCGRRFHRKPGWRRLMLRLWLSNVWLGVVPAALILQVCLQGNPTMAAMIGGCGLVGALSARHGERAQRRLRRTEGLQYLQGPQARRALQRLRAKSRLRKRRLRRRVVRARALADFHQAVWKQRVGRATRNVGAS